ncbi:hypothetical protein FHQ28_06565 [Pasteurellaceae bacterium USgator11]|nr:hypothetical protein FHQ19_04255 [Pasteurellaceae bacterium UScroc12]TNG97136.1 hypothetical protein FHQ20_03725 [Pasteurellaceae bacterium USgator41]TNH01141.1 hypothetical protein FHQ28_06565 [Pasteurellaceae bacterium USgator11]TNH01902.1 hypothetical protein FHQ24_00200 [Pasteurellaceae bacterium UScroc31]
MLSALLRSGDVKDYTALGQDGQAVYSIASQLRDTIRLKRGRVFSDYLAVPQRNDQGNRIDWYVPFESDQPDGKYFIIPWSSATSEEKQKALAELHVFEKTMLELGNEIAKNPSLKGDQLLFSRLLSGDSAHADQHSLKALRFPNAEHVYLVNDRPVITFWGFIEKNANVYGSPFLPLQPAAPIVAPATLADAVISEPIAEKSVMPWWRRWWFWLPLLGLLGLLLWWIWCTYFNVKPLSIEPDPVKNELTALDKTALAKNEVKKKVACIIDGNIITDAALCQPIKAKFPYVYDNNQWLDSNGAIVKDAAVLDKLQALDPNAFQPNVDQNSAASTPPTTEALDNKAAEQDDKAQTADATNAVNNPSDKDKDKDSDKNNQTGAVPPPSLDEIDKTKTDNPKMDNQSAVTDSQSNPPQNTQKNLNIPAQSLNSGNVDFLNGKWNAGAGIQDQTTGKPLRLNYEFNDGKGQVKVERSDGVQCTGNVGAGVSGGHLNIDNQGVAQCSDGSTYQLPTINCKPNTNGTAECEGIYGNSKFPISMKTP